MRFGWDLCPVCGSSIIETSRDYISEGTVCESYSHCPNGCWDYSFAYGNTDYTVTIRGHGIRMGHCWSMTPQEGIDDSNALDLIIAAAQQAILEDYRVLVIEANKRRKSDDTNLTTPRQS